MGHLQNKTTLTGSLKK